jgi:Fe-S cluster assembly iron-binding protein IscA
VTSAAADHLQATRPGKNYFIRITVMSGGGRYLESEFGWVRHANQNDTICETQGVGFIMDDVSLQYFSGGTVDYPGRLVVRSTYMG